MVQIALIGIGAGAAAALLFASVLSGSPLSVLLFYLAPLPILVAALLAAFGLAAALGTFFLLAFFLSIGLPAWWLSYLALLARPTEAPTPANLEWYPPGRLVLWSAVLGALVVIAVILNFSMNEANVEAALKRGFERMLRAQMHVSADAPLEAPGVADINRLLDFMTMVVPPAAAAVTTLTQLFNLWLAGRVVKMSGRLRRPWPDLAALAFSRSTPLWLAAALAGSFLPNLLGLCARLFVASLLTAYAVLGFALVHAITRGLQSRPIVLVGVYTAVAIFGWPILLIMLIGLLDAAFDLRARLGPKRGPPAASAS